MSHTDFTRKLNLKHPLIVAPMAGGPSSVELVISSCEAGALGSIGAAYSKPKDIQDFVSSVRKQTSKPFAINLFIPHDDPPISDLQMARALQATEKYRKEFGLATPTLQPPYEENFDEQFEMILKLKPAVLSFVFGLLEPEYIEDAHQEGILLFGTATSLDEAMALQDSGIDAITLQGFEAGGHRGIFDPEAADPGVAAMDLLEQCSHKLKIPLIAAGGLMNAQDIQKALSRGASAVQMGTAFLACQEAGTSEPYRRALLGERKTKLTRVYSGRLARGIENKFMLEMEEDHGAILPFQAQNQFTRDIRSASVKNNSSEYASLWSGMGPGPLWTGSAKDLIEKLFS